MSYRSLFPGKTIARVSALDSEQTEFIVLVSDSYSAMGFDYGPPDPPPSMETTEYVSVVAIKDEEELIAWIADHTRRSHHKAFKVIKYQPVTIETQVKITVS
jgi:hypothetical protein